MVNVMDLFSLDGKVAVVTGAASGLGIEFADAMAEAGADVVCADIDGAGAKRTAERVEERGGQGLAVTCDVTDEQAVADLFRAAVDAFGTVDVAINNAGIADAEPAPIHEYKTANWNAVMAVDLQGVFYCCREALGIMVSNGSGKVINVASMWGLNGASSVFPIPAYNAAKGAVCNLTRELALQYAPHGIQVNALCPGFFSTNLAGGAYEDPDFVAAITAFTPAERVADASEIKGSALYLASGASDYTNGLMLVTDGGCSAK